MADLDVGWSDEALPLGSHVCYYYSGDAALNDTLAFLRLGLDRPRDFCVLFADQSRHESLLARLALDYSGDLSARQAEGKLVLIGGAPTREELARQIVECLDRAVADGYTAIRFLGLIGWDLPGWPDAADLLEFEATVNDVVAKYPAVIACTYGIPTLSGPTLIYGGLQTHPLVIIEGRPVSANPLARRAVGEGGRVEHGP